MPSRVHKSADSLTEAVGARTGELHCSCLTFAALVQPVTNVHIQHTEL